MSYRERCLEEHGEQCEICGTSVSVEVHHIDGDGSNNDLDNLVPICRDHHNEIHADNGKLENWTQKLQDPPSRKSVLNFRIEETELEKLEAEAEEQGLNLSSYMRQIVRDRHVENNIEQRVDEIEDELAVLRRAILKEPGPPGPV